jgi:hypothetical protein
VPLLFGREQRVLHQLLEGFKALHVYSNRILVALLGAVKGILFGVADTPEKAHGCFESSVGHLITDRGIVLVAAFRPPRTSLPWLCLPFVCYAPVGDEVCRIALAEDRQSLLESRLLDEAVAGEISTLRASSDEILLHEECVGAGVIARSKVHLGEPERIGIVI